MATVQLACVENRTIAGVVVVHGGDPPQPVDGHEVATRAAIARELALLRGFVYGGEYDPAFDYAGAVYHVPRDTLIGASARALGIRAVDDLFGGVAPHAFVATKSIGHPLISRDAVAPPGWSHAFADAVAGDALDGLTAFSREDALKAGTRLLARGPVRVKRSLGIGGAGQWVAHDRDALARAIGKVDADEVARCGVVIEQNLDGVVTYSVGQVHVGALTATYHGTQRIVRNNAGHEVYGGSDLTIARGGFEALLALDVPDDVREAIDLARRWHAAALVHYRGLVLSRSNYDIARGVDAAGCPRCGVLEQSWRLGGASGAEVAALAAFARDPALDVVDATTVEHYGDDADVPAGAIVHYRDVDPRVGPLTKYVTVGPHDAR